MRNLQFSRKIFNSTASICRLNYIFFVSPGKHNLCKEIWEQCCLQRRYKKARAVQISMATRKTLSFLFRKSAALWIQDVTKFILSLSRYPCFHFIFPSSLTLALINTMLLSSHLSNLNTSFNHLNSAPRRCIKTATHHIQMQKVFAFLLHILFFM